MEAVLLSIHLIVTIALVVTILLQRSEGGALGIGGNAGGMMTGRGATDFLNKATRWLAVVFLACALGLGWISANRNEGSSVLEKTKEADQTESQLPALPTLPDDG